MTAANYVAMPPTGLVVALQFWQGDQAKAMRLARLLADIEPVRRTDVTLAFCSRHAKDSPATSVFLDEGVREVVDVCGEKFDTWELSVVGPDGHPDGCNALWSRAAERLAEKWHEGSLFSSAFFIEPDGVPLRRTWIDDLKTEHADGIAWGLRVMGPVTERPLVHFNGSLMMHLSTWFDMPSLHHTPSGQAWDLYHAAALMSAGRGTQLIKNVYGSGDATPRMLAALARETAWLASAKDDTAIAWAESELRAR